MRERRDSDRLKSEMEELFADLCQVPRLVAQRGGFRPAVDVYRTEDPPAITVVVELAGIEADEVEIAVKDHVLAVRGTRRRETRGGRVYQHIEIDQGRFERRVALPDAVDSDAAEAAYDRGLLSIRLPLVAKSGPVRVEVKKAES